MQKDERTPEYVSDIIVEIMHRLGVEYVALNPGATVRGLHDSVVQYGGNENPNMILCSHEEIAVAIADGYARASGKPMAVMVHDTVGLQHASKAIYEAWLSKIPMLILGGTGPLPVGERRPLIDWIHTTRMNANQVRDYVKWDNEPYDVTGAVESILRGYKIAMTLPKGPVYLSYDVLLQEQKLEPGKVKIPNVERFKPSAPPQIDGETIDKIARHLVNASSPLIVTGHVGMNPASFSHLVELAEALSIPVLDNEFISDCLNFPNTNDLDVTGGEEEVLKDADLVLGVDAPDLEDNLTLKKSKHDRSTIRPVPDSAPIINIGMDEYATRGWTEEYRRMYPVDISVAAGSEVALPAILARCKQLLKPEMKATMEERREYARQIHRRLREGWAEEAQKSWDLNPVSGARLASEMWDIIKSEDWVLGHTASLEKWIRRLWRLEDPRRYYYPSISTGSGLGVSIGVALAHGGAKAAEAGKLFVTVIGDGDMLYTAGTLWTAASLKIPMLVVMYNNRSYYQDELHQAMMARTRNRDPSKIGAGIRIIEPETDFAALAKPFGLNGVGPIKEPDQVSSAIRKGIDLVRKDKKVTIVDVVVQPR